MPDAGAETPEIGWIFTHPGILAGVRQSVGDDRLVFTHEADLHRNIQAGNWHKDSGEQVMADGYFGCGRDLRRSSAASTRWPCTSKTMRKAAASM